MRQRWEQDLRHLIRGMLGTLLIAGAIATLLGTLYVTLVTLASYRGDIFKRLLIPGLPLRLLAALLVQSLIWWVLARQLPLLPQGTTRLIFWSMMAALPLCLMSLLFAPT